MLPASSRGMTPMIHRATPKAMHLRNVPSNASFFFAVTPCTPYSREKHSFSRNSYLESFIPFVMSRATPEATKSRRETTLIPPAACSDKNTPALSVSSGPNPNTMNSDAAPRMHSATPRAIRFATRLVRSMYSPASARETVRMVFS